MIAYDLLPHKFARTLGLLTGQKSRKRRQKINPNIKRYELPKDIESVITGTARMANRFHKTGIYLLMLK